MLCGIHPTSSESNAGLYNNVIALMIVMVFFKRKTEKSIMSLIPAATVMITHAEESQPAFLLVRRHPSVPVLGNVWVFPGGRLSEADTSNANPNKALRACAARETKEEAGLNLDPSRLIRILQWETPENILKRFDTRFFAAVLDRRPTVRVDGYEIIDHRWLTAGAALRHHDLNKIQLSPPAYVLLSWAAALRTTDQFLAFFRKDPTQRVKPRNIALADGSCNLFKDDVAYESGDLALEGDRHRLWMRASGWCYEGGPFQQSIVKQ